MYLLCSKGQSQKHQLELTRVQISFNSLTLEKILAALTREIGDGPCFLYIKFSLIGVLWHVLGPFTLRLVKCLAIDQSKYQKT